MGEWRNDPSTGRRVRIAPARAARPSDFGRTAPRRACPFCAGSEDETPPESDRIAGADGGWLCRVVPNRYPAFDDADGRQEVIIESPRHTTRFTDLTADEATAAVTMWARRVRHWRAAEGFGEAWLFKNEGPLAGASLEHTHSQIVALPKRAAAEPRPAARPAETILRDDALVAACPAAPRFAYESWIHAASPSDRFDELATDAARAAAVAALLQRLLAATARASGVEAYNLMLIDDGTAWRLELTPRSAVLAGFELATGWWINAVPPERAAASLRAELER